MLAGALPEREVGRVALVGLDLDPMAGVRLLDPLARELPVGRELRDVVVDGAVDLVGEPAIHQLLR